MSFCRFSEGGFQSLRSAKGFTLVELGVVLAVIAVMAGAVMADVVEIAKNRAAQNAAAEIVMIQQAAKDFYHDTMIDQTKKEKPVNPELAHWPGETQSASHGHWQTCGSGDNLSASTEQITQDLKSKGALGTSFSGKNSWQKPYLMALRQTTSGAWADSIDSVWGCGFFIATDVPAEVAGVIQTFLPTGICNNSEFCGDPDPGPEGSDKAAFARCCTMIPRPGMEASLAQAKTSLEFWVKEEFAEQGATPPPSPTDEPVYTGETPPDPYVDPSGTVMVEVAQ